MSCSLLRFVSGLGCYKIWYRHSGQQEIANIPPFPRYKILTEAAIVNDVADRYITHLAVEGEVPPLDSIAPELNHLKIDKIIYTSHLNRYLSSLLFWFVVLDLRLLLI